MIRRLRGVASSRTLDRRRTFDATRPARTRRKRFTVFAVAIALAFVPIFGGRGVASEPTLEMCLGNDSVVTLSGTYQTGVRYTSPAPGTTFDARGATFVSYPYTTLYPFSLGKKTAPTRLCAVGGIVTGQQPSTLTWDEMKTTYDGDGLRIAGNDWYAVDGLRVNNVEDGVAPRGTENLYPEDGDGFTMRNLYFTFIRDDCVENDDIAGGLISDSLFDGCYTGVSEKPSDGSPQLAYPAPAGETLQLDHVLLRLQAMPGPRGTNDPSILGHGQLFKWSPVANSLVIRDSVFLIEATPNGTSYCPFPPGTVTENVTLVWRGPGSFNWSVPAGTTVTTDRAIWDDARASWLARHGCTSFDACTKLYSPDPIQPSPSPSPSSSPTPTPTPTPTPSPTSSVSESPTPSPSASPTASPSSSPSPTPSPSPTGCPSPRKGKPCR